MKKIKSWNNRFEKIKLLGKGGNAEVYYVREKNTNNKYALKQLYNNSKEKKIRFKNEIIIAKKNADEIHGIIPIIDSCTEECWYTMPLATEVMNKVSNMDIDQIVIGIIQLSDTLEKLHLKGISHRDIKPSNIYIYNKRFSLGDFGLVDFPDNLDEFTKSDKGLGAIFTIAPEMKRDPKHADGKKADVFSLAKTLWILLSGCEKGFDGVYNYLDPSHSLRYLKKYENTHLVELEELMKDATNNEPDLRPTIKEFKERLLIWKDIYSDKDKAQASDWNFINKQIFGFNVPESSTWTDINSIIEILNIVGKTPAYNHMLFPDRGGLDFSSAELANEKGCIKLYDTMGLCCIIKPKKLYYESFNKDYKWNYFLLELDKLNPIFENPTLMNYEYLVEDIPSHYVSARYAQYGVYDYDTGIPLPKGYKIVRRYLRGKFLIVMKSGPYNGIPGTYDGRHGDCSSEEFRIYIEKLIKRYNEIYICAKHHETLKDINDDILIDEILNTNVFNRNPFKISEDTKIDKSEIKKQKLDREKTKMYIKNNYTKLCFKNELEFQQVSLPKIGYCFCFEVPDTLSLVEIFKGVKNYICKDGFVKKLKSPLQCECYHIYDRTLAIKLKEKFNTIISEILKKNNLSYTDNYENYISIELFSIGKPIHLFTKQEIKEEMKKADDRYNNQLVIDENGYAKVIKVDKYEQLFPVALEVWEAGNMYVGKYSTLSTIDDNYILSLQGWLGYLKTGKKQYIDYIYGKQDERELIDEINKYY